MLNALITLHTEGVFFCVLSAEHAAQMPLGLEEASTVHFAPLNDFV